MNASPPRDVWLSSHLLNDPAGAAAHRDATALGAAAHEALLAIGDRLAVASAVLAQQYYRHAAAAWRAFESAAFLRWWTLGEQLATVEPICRDGAMAYFAVAPTAFGSGGLDTAAEWCRLGNALAAVSPKLAGVFFGTTASLLRKPDGLARLTTWAEVGRGLYQQHGWHGEFLAQAFFSAAPHAVLTLSPDSYQLWAGAGAALAPAIKEREFFGALPRAIRRWSPRERELFLRITLALATVAAKPAFLLYRELPGSLESVDGAAREGLLRVLARTGKRLANAVADVVPVAGALLRQVPEAHLLAALAHVEEVAARFPDAVGIALSSLPRLYEEASPPVVSAWFATGLKLAADNPQAGLAYFALESRTSLRVLREASTSATLDELQGLLRKYIQMLSGQPTSLRGVEGVWLRPPLEEFPFENEVALPLRVDLLATHEDNARLYRFLAAQLAGRREFGTYDFTPPTAPVDPDAPLGSALLAYLERAEHPEVLEDLFLLAEGFRVQHRLCAMYKGVADESRWVSEHLLARWAQVASPSRAMIFDGLLAVALLDGAAAVPAWLAGAPASIVRELLAPLTQAAASVQDAMRIAHALSEALSPTLAPRARGEMLLGDLLLDHVTGDALIDPYFDEGDEGAPAQTAPRVPSVSAPQDGEPPEISPLELSPQADDGSGGAQSISADELKRLLDAGANLRITQGAGDDTDGLGLYITDLLGKIPSEQIEALRQLLGAAGEGPRRVPRRWKEESGKGESFLYDEWDYHIGDYRSHWCRLHEVNLEGDSGEFFNRALTDYARVIPEVRRQFQRIRPDMYRTVRGLEDGEDFDLNAAIEARVEVRAGRVPTGKLYVARVRQERDVATLFLVDMSASTDEPLVKTADDAAPAPRGSRVRPRRIIDVTKETLVVMAEALEEIGDAYAIYGFSGHGRDNVEVYRVKSFAESLTPTVKGRMGGIEPKRSTRMGAALRHAVEKLAGVSARSKHLFLLSDGFPQDFDYGQDRRSNVYGIRDTAVALREAEAAGVTPFCITVDKAGHDYLRQMCDESRYMVIEDITALPRELPKIYQRIVRA